MSTSVTHHIHHHHHFHHHYSLPTTPPRMPSNQHLDRYARRLINPTSRTDQYVGPGASYWQQFPVSRSQQQALRAMGLHQGSQSGGSYYGGYARGYAYPNGGGYYGGFGYPTYGDVGD